MASTAKLSIGDRVADLGDRAKDAAGGLVGRGGVDEPAERIQ